MKRRALLIGAAAATLFAGAVARAQPASRVYRVGVLLPMAGLAAEPYLAAMRRKLAAHGLAESRNLRLDIRYGGESPDARELAATRPDALFALTTVLAKSAQAADGNVPLVFAWVADPVQSGLTQTYARPGGTATGVTNRFSELLAKRVELVRELMPKARRLAVAAGFFDAGIRAALPHAEAAAKRLQMTVIPFEAGVMWRGTLDRALAAGADAILVLTPFAWFGMHYVAEDVVGFTLERRVPTLFSDAESVPLGGLLSYGSDPHGEVEQASDMLARVLKGEKPADLAVQFAARFHLALNLKTARAIGVEVPQSILLRADRVIE